MRKLLCKIHLHAWHAGARYPDMALGRDECTNCPETRLVELRMLGGRLA